MTDNPPAVDLRRRLRLYDRDALLTGNVTPFFDERLPKRIAPTKTLERAMAGRNDAVVSLVVYTPTGDEAFRWSGTAYRNADDTITTLHQQKLLNKIVWQG